jgi:hypothetical protein
LVLFQSIAAQAKFHLFLKGISVKFKNQLSCILHIFLIIVMFTTRCSVEDQIFNVVKYNEIAEQIVKTALEDEKGYELLRELTEIGPRFAGSDQSMTAIKWAEAKMKEMGFDKVELQPVTVPHWVRGNVEEARLMTPGNVTVKNLSITALGGSIGTTEAGIMAEIIEVRSFEELQAVGDKAEGKIVFFNYPMKKGLADSFEAYGDAFIYRSSGASEAAKAGGVAAIVRSVTTKYDNNPHTGAMNYEEGVKQVPAVAVGLIDADFLSDAIKKDPGLRVQLNLSCEMLPDVPSYNVICEITGTEFPDEVIVVGGHFDSWDIGTGAHDDGGGCIQALEVLDLYRRLEIKPKRTIRCVFFINEEFGVNGGIKYGEYALQSSEKHVAAIESDRGLFTPRGFSVDANSGIIDKMQKWLPALQKAGIEWVRAGGSGVDISRIQNVTALIGYVPDGQRYFDFHHSANDVFEGVHPREMEMGSAAMAILAYLISEEGL